MIKQRPETGKQTDFIYRDRLQPGNPLCWTIIFNKTNNISEHTKWPRGKMFALRKRSFYQLPRFSNQPLYLIKVGDFSSATSPLFGRQGDAFGVVVGKLTKKNTCRGPRDSNTANQTRSYEGLIDSGVFLCVSFLLLTVEPSVLSEGLLRRPLHFCNVWWW
jgi:hypothetical protein